MANKTPKSHKCTSCCWVGNGNKAKKVKYPGVTFIVCPICFGKIEERQEWRDHMTEECKRQKILSCFGDFREDNTNE